MSEALTPRRPDSRGAEMDGAGTYSHDTVRYGGRGLCGRELD